jgi:hypothetical protein
VLYYKSSLDNSLASEQLLSNIADKSQITANFCCNADSSHKLDIFFIAKALWPHAFKVVKHIESLGCQLLGRAKPAKILSRYPEIYRAEDSSVFSF